MAPVWIFIDALDPNLRIHINADTLTGTSHLLAETQPPEYKWEYLLQL